MNDTDRQLHIAAQYLAAAGKNYVEHQRDDSHTNLGWIEATSSFVTHAFSNGDSLELQTCALTIRWNGNSGGSLALVGTKHKDVLRWLNEMATKNAVSAFVFDLHYSIDSVEFSDELSFSQVDGKRCQQLAEYRSIAYASCAQLLTDLDLKSDVRTWPHHFDTGAYASIPDTETGIGFGLAIPDSMCSDHYLYASGYQGLESLSTKGFPALSRGDWRDGDWKGAVLAVTSLDQTAYDLFFKETIAAFMSRR